MPWFSKKSKQSIIRRKQGSAERIIYFVKRIGVILAAIVFLGWAGSWFFLSDADSKTASFLQNKFFDMTARAGFSVETILVEGRRYTDSDALKAIPSRSEFGSGFDVSTQAAARTWVDVAQETSDVYRAALQG